MNYDDDIYHLLERHNSGSKTCYCHECNLLRRSQYDRDEERRVPQGSGHYLPSNYYKYEGVTGSYPPEQVFVADCYGNERVKDPVQHWKNAYWKCQYCGILQLTHLVTCTKCGAPREE